MADTPRIYLTTYELYNNGNLDGEWIDLSQFEDGEAVISYFRKKIRMWEKKYGMQMDELMFPDHENIPDSLYDEGMNAAGFDKVINAYKISEEKDIPMDVVADIIREYAPDDVGEWIDERYQGKYDSDTELGEGYVDMMGGIEMMDKETLERYFDYESFGRDLAYDYRDFDGYYFRSYKKGGIMRKKKGSKASYERLVKKVAAHYEGKSVKPKYQSKYGKTYDEGEAKQVGYAVATSVMGRPKFSKGGRVKIVPYTRVAFSGSFKEVTALLTQSLDDAMDFVQNATGNKDRFYIIEMVTTTDDKIYKVIEDITKR
jgi:antirestriction protein